RRIGFTRAREGECEMKWITREHVKVDRVACPWLIRRFIDPDAEFLFVPAAEVMETAKRTGAIPFDAPNVELGHHGSDCSFDSIVKKYKLTADPAMVSLARIVNGADTENAAPPERGGLKALAWGFRRLGFKDDLELNLAEWIVYDALYAFCQAAVEKHEVAR